MACVSWGVMKVKWNNRHSLTWSMHTVEFAISLFNHSDASQLGSQWLMEGLTAPCCSLWLILDIPS